jgi:hypothetical protein
MRYPLRHAAAPDYIHPFFKMKVRFRPSLVRGTSSSFQFTRVHLCKANRVRTEIVWLDFFKKIDSISIKFKLQGCRGRKEKLGGNLFELSFFNLITFENVFGLIYLFLWTVQYCKVWSWSTQITFFKIGHFVAEMYHNCKQLSHHNYFKNYRPQRSNKPNVR